MGDQTTATLTSVNSGWGSRNYCAPEQARDFHNVTFAADIYSFGCILHDLAADDQELRYPYMQATTAGPLGGVIEKCTEVLPKKRFQGVADLRGILFKVLAKKGPAPSQKAAEWVEGLEEAAEWDVAKVKELVRSLRKMDDDTDRGNVFGALDEQTFGTLHEKDPEGWEELAREYCRWVANQGFDFEYCDVLVRRLETVFYLGAVGVKAAVALAVASLGKTHNRWFVMRRLLVLCGPALDEKVAERISIEIVAECAQPDFIRCAERISKETDAYHPSIADVLREYENGKRKRR